MPLELFFSIRQKLFATVLDKNLQLGSALSLGHSSNSQQCSKKSTPVEKQSLVVPGLPHRIENVNEKHPT